MKIGLTGGNGQVGQILQVELRRYDLMILDLPKHDVRDQEALKRNFKGLDRVIHLAWDTVGENFQNGQVNPENNLMTYNVYEASRVVGVPRVVMASSVHADSFSGIQDASKLSTGRIPTPTSPYGASKVFMESLGRYYATQGLEVVCIRLGDINSEDSPHEEPEVIKNVWLSRRDCGELFQSCIDVQDIPNNFSIVYGISNNRKRVHNLSNPFGWVPNDDSYNFSIDS